MAQETVSAESTWLEADQSRCDAAWERMQERALKAFRDGDLAAAAHSWAAAFDIAKQHFTRGDPRLAASYTNHAFALIRQDQLHPATLLLNDAVRCWAESWRWVPLMRPLPGDGQSTEDRYDDTVLPEFYAFIKRGQAITETLAKERQLPNGGLEEWQENRPSTMCDLRKLVSAVLLMASRAP